MADLRAARAPWERSVLVVAVVLGCAALTAGLVVDDDRGVVLVGVGLVCLAAVARHLADRLRLPRRARRPGRREADLRSRLQQVREELDATGPHPSVSLGREVLPSRRVVGLAQPAHASEQ